MANPKTVAIVGSGISGVALAYVLTQKGHRVKLFERGFQLPDSATRYNLITNLSYPISPANSPRIAENLYSVAQSGFAETHRPIQREIYPYVGGMAQFWAGIAVRMFPSDFLLRDKYQRGVNWPVDYNAIEPYYGRAERFMSVSGTDSDNPFAPPRSMPYPLPAFDLGYYDQIMAERLREVGITLHSTPQARMRHSEHDRIGCQNTGICYACPFSALYTPIYHLNKVLETGMCDLYSEVSVRRIIVAANGKAAGVLVQPNDLADAYEVTADCVIVATGAVEAPRLLLLSATDHFRDGVGNESGHVGQHLNFHIIRNTAIRYPDPVFSGRVGFWTGQSMQFADHANRDQVGGVKLEASDRRYFSQLQPPDTMLLNQDEVRYVELLSQNSPLYQRQYSAHAESDTSPDKLIALSEQQVDAFGDPVAHVHHELSEFDQRTFEFSREILDKVAAGTGGEIAEAVAVESWDTGHHHMGTTRMADREADGVVDRYGQVFGTQNVFVAGSSCFSGTSAVNPTLTLLALALQTGDYLLDQILS